MSSNQLTLFVPGLLARLKGLDQLTGRDWPALPALERLLSAATRQSSTIDEMHRGLFGLFDIELDDEQELPVAQFSYLADTGTQPEQHYWRADPVHITIDREHAVLLEHEMLEISQEDAEQLVGAINEHFAGEGLHMYAPHSHHWYAHFDKAMPLATTALERVLHQNVEPYLPRGEGAGPWSAWLNEIQMLLFSHPINQQRIADGAYSVNSIWLWGGGQNRQAPQAHFDHVWSDDPVARGLAASARTAHSALPVPIDMQQVLRELKDGRGLIVQPHLFAAVNDQDVFEWLSLLQWLETKYFVPLCEALQDRQLAELSLLPCNGERWVVSGKALKRWWRRRKPLTHWLARH